MKLSTLLLTLCFPLASFAQTPLTSPKDNGNHNPINPWNFCADPTSVEYNGRVYVYGTNDQQQFDEGNGFNTNGNDYGKINSLVCMSSADLVNWTIHAPIKVKDVTTKNGSSWVENSWAPSICSREEADGKTHFYLYFANGGSGIGVLTSTSPTGPWKDPLGKLMINWGQATMGDIVWLFDPGVVVDENGTGWLTWGGGGEPHEKNIAKGANAMLDMNTRIAKLKPDMVHIDGDIKILPAPYHFEASELNIIGGKFVYTYCSNWSGDRSMWNQFTQYDHSKTKPTAPGTAQMCYMTSTDPLNPDSWMYEGMYGKNPSDFGLGGGNNHTHLQKFNGNYYYFYHAPVTEGKLMSMLGGSKGGYRNILVNKATVDETNCKISQVSLNKTGVTQITENRPIITELQEAEMVYNYSQGAEFTQMSNLKGRPGAMRFTKANSWISVRKVFSEEDVKSFTAKLRGKGKMEIRVGRNAPAAKVGTVEFNSTSLAEYKISLDKPFSGENDIYFTFTEVDESKTNDFDNWQFFTEDISAISSATESDATVKEEFFNLSGVKCNEKPADGICIVKRTLANGKQVTEKVCAE